MKITCPECPHVFEESFGLLTCPQCTTRIVVRCTDKLTQSVAVETLDDPRTGKIWTEGPTDLQMGVLSADGEAVRGVCALCETFHPRFDLMPIQVGKLLFTKKLVKERRPDGVLVTVVKRVCVPLVRKAFACRSCYGDYCKVTVLSTVEKQDGTSFHRSFVTLPFRRPEA